MRDHLKRTAPLTQGHEPDDVSTRAIVIFIAGFILCMALCFGVVEFTLRRLVASTPPPGTSSEVGARRLANNAPVIQPTETVDHAPIDDLQIIKTHEDNVFAALGWEVDRKSHREVIPNAVIQSVLRTHQNEANR